MLDRFGKMTLMLLLCGTAFSLTAHAQKPELVVQTGHTGTALPLGFSPDNRILVTGGFKAVKLWDIATGREIKTLATAKEIAKPTPLVSKLSPNGKIVVSGQGDEFITVWDVSTGDRFRFADNHLGFMITNEPFEFSPDGKVLLSRGPFGGWMPTDLQSGKNLTLLRNTTAVDKYGRGDKFIAFAPDGKTLAFKNYDNVVKLWDVASGQELKIFGERLAGASEAAFSPDSRTILTEGKGIAAKLLDVATGREMSTLKGVTGEETTFAFSPDGKVLAGTREGSVRLWDVASGEELRTLQGLGSPAYLPFVLFSPDGRRLLANGQKVVKVWDVSTGRELNTLGGEEYQLMVGLSPDGKMITSVSFKSLFNVLSVSEYTFRLHDAATGRELKAIKGCPFVQFSRDVRTLAAGCADGNVKVFDVGTGEELQVLNKHAEDVVLVTLSPDGQTLASGVSGGLAGNKLVLLLKDFAEAIAGLAVKDALEAMTQAIASNIFATGTNNREIKLWNLTGGKAPRTLRGHTGTVRSIAFSPDGRLLASASEDKTVKLWDASTGAEVKTLRGHTATVSVVAFSHDGRTLASAGNELTIRLWDVATGREVKTLKHSQTQLTAALAFSPDDKMIATGGIGGDQRDKLKLWDLATGSEIKTLTWEKAFATSLAFSSDGKLLVVRNAQDGVIKLFDIASGKEVKSFPQSDAKDVREIFAVAPDFYRKGDEETVTPDGRILIRKGSNARLDLTDIGTERLLASLIALDKNDWAVVAPDGRFDTNKLENPQGLHWLLPDAPLAPLSFEVFMRDYFEPKLLPRLLRCAGEGNCEHEFKPIRDLSSLNRTQPNVRITGITPADSPDTVVVSVEVRETRSKYQKDAAGRPLSSGGYDLRLFRDGQLVGHSTTDRELQDTFRNYKGFADELAAWRGAHNVGLVKGRRTFNFKVKLPNRPGGRQIEFSAYAFNNDRVKSETARVAYTPPAGPTPRPRPKRAYVITFGANKYDNPAWDLQFAGNDARAMRDIISAHLRQRAEFAEVVEVSLISDSETVDNRKTERRDATKANIRSVFELLAGKTPPAEELKNLERAIGARVLRAIRQANPDDMVLVSFSSHGYADKNGIFHVLPTDIGKGGAGTVTDEVLRRSISSDELSLWLRDVDAGQMVMIVDACYAASAVEGREFKPAPMGSRGLGQLAFDKGMKILTATQATNVAIETGGVVRHGLLTFALVREGLERGKADFRLTDKTISLKEWLEYGEFRVPGLYDDLATGRLKGVGRTGADLVGVGERRPRNYALQQPSLFDFTRMNTELILVQLP